MRIMSFALTSEQILEGTKIVTRRLGWERLKPGELILPAYKCMGLKAGEKIEPIRAPLLVVSNDREPLSRMTEDLEYGMAECEREGFGNHPVYRWPQHFIRFFCSSHRGCRSDAVVSRIEFDYT